MKTLLRKMARRVHNASKRYNVWYQMAFQDCEKFWKGFPFGLQIVNLGSNSAFYGFNYDGLGVNAANWAMRPQSFPQDLAILKNYSSYLEPRAIILIALCPYSSCFKSYTDTEMRKYYTILHPGVMLNFSMQKCEEAFALKRAPWQVAKKEMVLGTLQYVKRTLLRKRNLEDWDYQPMDDKALKLDAMSFIEGWKRQFKIENMDDAELPQHIKEGRRQRLAVLREMLSFCKERDFVPVIVLPPVTNYLSSEFSDVFRRNYIYSFLEEVGIGDTRFLNYLEDDDFRNPDLYFNSFFLNKRGAGLFTKRVLADLKI